jgi:alpha-ketoglutarate-dependent taurine dioxygenase
MSVGIAPISELVGAAVTGIDLNAVTDDVVAQLGKTPEESRGLFEMWLSSAIRLGFVYRHKWQPGDLVIVDNRSAMHWMYDDHDRSEKRLLHRIIFKGDRPF